MLCLYVSLCVLGVSNVPRSAIYLLDLGTVRTVWYCFVFHFIAFVTHNTMIRHGRDRVVVGFTTICAISVYHH
jgi:hypothetical protein